MPFPKLSEVNDPCSHKSRPATSPRAAAQRATQLSRRGLLRTVRTPICLPRGSRSWARDHVVCARRRDFRQNEPTDYLCKVVKTGRRHRPRASCAYCARALAGSGAHLVAHQEARRNASRVSCWKWLNAPPLPTLSNCRCRATISSRLDDRDRLADALRA